MKRFHILQAVSLLFAWQYLIYILLLSLRQAIRFFITQL